MQDTPDTKESCPNISVNDVRPYEFLYRWRNSFGSRGGQIWEEDCDYYAQDQRPLQLRCDNYYMSGGVPSRSIARFMLIFEGLAYPVLPIWTLYLTGLPGLIGGNFDLGMAMLFASYTDVVPSTEERSTLFFLTTSMQFVSQAICPPIGGWLMNLDGQGGTQNVAMTVSLTLVAFSVVIAIFLFPETMSKQKDSPQGQSKDAPSSSSDPQQLKTRARSRLESLQTSLSGVGLTNALLLLTAILFATVAIKMTDWYSIIQYPVIKLGWTLPQVCLSFILYS